MQNKIIFSDFKKHFFNTGIISVALIILFISCNSYPEIKLDKKLIPASVVQSEQLEKSNKSGKFSKYYKQLPIDEKGYPSSSLKINRVSYNRYFANVFSFSPLAEINNQGIEYAFKNMYIEAEVLFSEVIKEDNNFSSACNNLAIIYELLNNKEKAFSMYSRACLLDPDNEYYRWNFLYFCDNKKAD